MMTFFRRLHSLAFLLVLASPGIGGVALPVLHPCPVDLPWLAGAETGHPGAGDVHHVAGHQGHGGQQAPQDQQGRGGAGDHGDGAAHLCSCMGSCCPGAMVDPPSASRLFLRSVPLLRTPLLTGELRLPGSDHLHLLPPSTAPPLI